MSSYYQIRDSFCPPNFGVSSNNWNREMRSLPSLDGLGAGLECVNKAASASPRNIAFSSPFRHEAYAAEWITIQNIEYSIETLWANFRNLTMELDQVQINHLYNQYHDASGLRDAGAFTFRGILAGSVPTDLETLFAGVCLAHAVRCRSTAMILSNMKMVESLSTSSFGPML